MTPQMVVALTLVPLLLGGCSLTPRDPLADPGRRLAESCTRTHPGERTAQIGAFAQALEAGGYEIRSSDVALGLISAERVRARPGLGAVAGGYRPGHPGGWGMGRGLVSPFDVFRHDPRSVERVSVSADGAGFTAVRSITTLALGGYIIDARPASHAGFCRELHGGAARILEARS